VAPHASRNVSSRLFLLDLNRRRLDDLVRQQLTIDPDVRAIVHIAAAALSELRP
jgi:hypothetical protein